MSEEKERLRQEADSLAQRLEAVMHDKFNSRASFDADTPIDKTLHFLQSFIAVCTPLCALATTSVNTLTNIVP